MTAYLLIDHLLNFAAPAAVVAFLLVLSSRLLSGFFMSKRPLAHNWRAQIAINFVVGLVVLAAGMVLLGRDGKMLTYVALVIATATSQFWLLGGWKR
jgi:hypothetical protein